MELVMFIITVFAIRIASAEKHRADKASRIADDLARGSDEADLRRHGCRVLWSASGYGPPKPFPGWAKGYGPKADFGKTEKQ